MQTNKNNSKRIKLLSDKKIASLNKMIHKELENVIEIQKQFDNPNSGPLMMRCPRCNRQIDFKEHSHKNAEERRWNGTLFVCDYCVENLNATN